MSAGRALTDLQPSPEMCLSPLQLLLLGLYLNVIDVHWTVLGVRDSNNGLDFICSLDFLLDFQLALVDMYELLKEIILFFFLVVVWHMVLQTPGDFPSCHQEISEEGTLYNGERLKLCTLMRCI